MRVPDIVRSKHLLWWLTVAGLALAASTGHSQAAPRRTFIRVNQLGYLPAAPKVAVACSLDSISIKSFSVQDLTGRVVFGPRAAKSNGRFGPCASTHRLDFSSLRSRGRYQIVAGGAYLYRRMTGDDRFREYEAAALDWLLGTNPWGVSMIIGLPQSGNYAHDPHSVVAKDLKLQLTGGLLDGPVYRSIYQNLLGISLHDPDEYAQFNTGFIVYHDDVGDYSTNEPLMDGTANLTYLFAAMTRP